MAEGTPPSDGRAGTSDPGLAVPGRIAAEGSTTPTARPRLAPDERSLEEVLSDSPLVARFVAMMELDEHPEAEQNLKDLATIGTRVIERQNRRRSWTTGILQAGGLAMIALAVILDLALDSLTGASSASLVLGGTLLIMSAPWVASRTAEDAEESAEKVTERMLQAKADAKRAQQEQPS